MPDTPTQIRLPQARIDGFDISAAFAAALTASETPVRAEQAEKRFAKIAQLVVLLVRRMDAIGPERPPRVAEAGVWRGLSARVLADAVRHRHPDWRGAGLHLIDGFTGLGAPSPQDLVRRADGSTVATQHATNFASSPDVVRATLADYPDCTVHAGLIPDVLTALPENRWDFVHLDTDHYAPIRDGLRYFLPRLAARGMVVNDDYGSTLFPGARAAWDEIAGENDVQSEALETGQALIVAG